VIHTPKDSGHCGGVDVIAVSDFTLGEVCCAGEVSDFFDLAVRKFLPVTCVALQGVKFLPQPVPLFDEFVYLADEFQ
jgi:hypothetical protein